MPTRSVRRGTSALRAVVTSLALGTFAAACAPADRLAAPMPQAPNAPRALVAVGPKVVISQVFGGGGSSASVPRADYVELYNAGDADATLDGWSVQYASATGTGNFSGNAVTPISGTLAPGQYYLVQMAATTTGTALPTPDATGTVNMSATGAKVAIVKQGAGLACNGGSVPCSDAQKALIADLVGWGTANFFEGSAAAPATTSSTALFRLTNGQVVDTDNNQADFTVSTPNPRNRGNTVNVSVAASPTTISVGGTTTLTVTVTKSGAAVTPTAITWASNPSGRVTFSNQSGNTVTGTGANAGSATVTATVTVDGAPYTGSTTVTVNAAASNITVEGYSFRGSDPLPVGFQELYRAKDPATNQFIRTGITWSTSDANVATVDALGNVTAIANGTVNVIATDASGRTGSLPLTVTTFAWSDTVGIYANPLQFGTPTDADPSDDVLVTRQTYRASWSDLRGQPNWVAYNLDAAHKTGSAADRCDCFTPDPTLPNGSKLVTTADYDGSGFSRGHMTMSADRTRGAMDNATTFFYTNIIPQTQQNNGGPWLGLEQYLGNLATGSDKEIYIFAGGARYQGWLASANGALSGQQRVAIPTYTWKVAVIMDRGKGLADVRSASDVRIIAVSMPNTTSIPQTTASWVNYQASVDSIESLTGYDLLSALPAEVQAQLEAQDPAVRTVGLELQPDRISVTTTSTVNAVLLSGMDFDATAIAAADLRLVTQGGTQVAPITRSGVVNTSLRDVNGDGRLDRVVGFSTAALRAAGFDPATPKLTMRLSGTGTPAWIASDAVPPTVLP